ncbi:DUF5916 domain-containing protein [Lysobacter solisilvae (ex Woo and Kim 2020)]|uniref:DUF5916 domain-containing protein n=1 Tax=Agrilutibacter terrestris TaxID=2865112 RepID=A0A7H0FTY4_9GAMM|nr:DUF5916 domain-containing protein [Lysobacter terrestris]QNP39500.1 hypothetical protein H8B22_08105 [Lysobacter terrestris]
MNNRSALRRTQLALALMSLAGSAHAAIAVDGKLDEPEWAQARRYTDFKTTQPWRLTAPEAGLGTQARLLSTPEGIAVAFVLEQAPGVQRIKPRLERDQVRNADRVIFNIDFDGDGRTAYAFTVSLSGSVQDGVLTNENQFSTDWDTDWSSAVSESEAGWQVEMLIPWSVAPMRGADTANRNVAVYFGRVVGSTGERQAFPAVAQDRGGRFVSDFDALEIPQYRSALLHVWPYATALHDFIDDRTRYKAGVDVFWKPSPNFQLSGTINPDFGQIEADDLVINFDAVETFFSDKRPFFTENQGIFDLRTPDSGRLIHTRRIGAGNDINAALKLNGGLGTLGYGLLAASEDGDDGRDFYAARLQLPLGEALNIGWLGTDTERAAIDRRAQVQAVDLRWKPSNTLIVSAQALASAIGQQGVDTRDSGGWVRTFWTPTDRWSFEVEATHFGAQLNFNDLGYQRRPSLNELEVTADFNQRIAAEQSRLRNIRWVAEVQARSNDSGDRLPTWLLLTNLYNFRSGNQLTLFAAPRSAGWDDRISRGNGLYRVSGRYDAEAEFTSARYGDWTFAAGLGLAPVGLSATPSRTLSLSASWYPSETFNAEFELAPEWSDDWLIWHEGRDFGRYARRLDYAGVNLGWFPAAKHELRLKSQWLAIRARDGRAYRLQPAGDMQATGAALPNFDINELGLQLRYRYLLGPQSDLFLAYSRGGAGEHEREGGIGTDELLEEALRLRDSDQFLAKVRYRF